MKRVAVIGGGPMGLACAYELLRTGWKVDVYEADDRLGGMSAHFDFKGLSIERFYHFICKPDQPLFDLLKELNLEWALKWKDTSMGYYHEGRHYHWGNPIALLRFSPLPFFSRLRYGLHMFYCTKVKNWRKFDNREASQWITRWVGETAYKTLWQRLFSLKFHQHVGNLSASWIWARIRRVGQSRKNLFQEQLGYLVGGSETLLKAFEDAIRQLGGRIYLSTPVYEIAHDKKRVVGLKLKDGDMVDYDTVVSTVPLPFVPRLIKGLPEGVISAYQALNNIGVVCLIFKLARPLTSHFWLNISDERMQIPGIIEMSNLQPFEHSIVYVPFYLPQDHPKYNDSDEAFIKESLSYFKLLCEGFSDDDVVDVHVSRYGYAQPICPPGFLDTLPPINTHIDGLYVMDTSYYYPEDRSISESVQLGRRVARDIVGE